MFRCVVPLCLSKPRDLHASSTFAGLDTESAGRIDDRDQAHDAAVAFLPTPRECRKSHPLARHLVDVAADIFETANAGGQDRVVARLPFGEVLDDLASVKFLVFLIDFWQESIGSAGPVGADRGAERMI